MNHEGRTNDCRIPSVLAGSPLGESVGHYERRGDVHCLVGAVFVVGEMKKSKTEIQQEQMLNRARKTAPSRDKAEAVRRIALFLEDDSDDQRLLMEVSEFLLDVRQALRGGRRSVGGSRHWNMED